MIARVLVELSNRNIDKTFSYLIPKNLENKVQIGVRVLVPFANLKIEGFVLDIIEYEDEDYELKEIIEVIDEDIILTKELLELGKYMSSKTLATLISCYQVMLPNGYKAKRNKKVNIKYETYVYLNELELAKYKISDKQQIIINILRTKKNVTYTYLKKINTSVDTLIKKGILTKEKVEVYRKVFLKKLN